MLPIEDDRIVIASRTQAARILCSTTQRPAIHAVISIGGADDRPPAGLGSFWPRLRLVFEDEVLPVQGGPTADHVARIIAFSRTVDLRENRVLIHCHAGISRSSAAAVIVLAVALDVAMATEIAEYLRRVHPHCVPNRLMLQLADELLETGGALERALYDSVLPKHASESDA